MTEKSLDLISANGLLPRREQNSHKGTYGNVLLICGSKNMVGCCALAAEGALRSGAGLVTIPVMRHFDEEAKEISKRYISLRYTFAPYLYNLVYRMNKYGELFESPMFYHYQDDLNCLDINDQYALYLLHGVIEKAEELAREKGYEKEFALYEMVYVFMVALDVIVVASFIV